MLVLGLHAGFFSGVGSNGVKLLVLFSNLNVFLKVWSSRTARWMIKGLLQPSFDDKRRLAKLV